MLDVRNLFLLLICVSFSGCATAQTTSPTHTVSTTPSPSFTIGADSFTSDEGKFSINLSRTPMLTQNLNGQDASGTAMGKIFAWRIGELAYTVQFSEYSDLTENSPPEKRKQFLNQFNEGVRKAIKKNQGEITSEKPIEIDGHIGTELRATTNGMLSIMRNYLADERGYQVQAFFRDSKDEPQALMVLNSFKLIK